MEIYSYWLMLALVLLGLEMATGTFYMLVVSVAAAVAGLAALMHAGMEIQLMLCALVVIGGTIALRSWKKTQIDDQSNASLDVGQAVQVLAWHDNGSARVVYRGAEWDAEPESADMPHDGECYIKQMHGSTLVLTHRKP